MLSFSYRALVPGHLLHHELADPAKQPRQLRSWHPFVPAVKEFLRTIKEQNINVARWVDHTWSAELCNSASRLCSYIPDTRPRPLVLALPRPAWTRLNHLHTGFGHFHSSMHKWGMGPSVNCKCGMENPTADNSIQRCQYMPPNGIHGLQVLDDDTIKRLSTSCPNI